MTQPNSEKLSQYQAYLKENPRLYEAVLSTKAATDDLAAQVAQHVLAPALGGFVQWLLTNAVRNGIKRLYFLARDGYWMHQMALRLCKALPLPIECRYLCCSRYSLRLPTYHLDKQAAPSYVCRGGLHVTMGTILRRAGLTQEEQDEVAHALSVSLGEEVPHARLGQVRRRLSSCALFLSYMRAHSKRAFPALTGYLRQEGLLDGEPYAVVDSGWVGSMQKTLGDALAHLGCSRPLEGYYFGLYELPKGTDPNCYHSYCFGPTGPVGEKVYFNNCLFEAVFTAPHGMTLSYREENGRYVPCFGCIQEEYKKFLEKTGEVYTAYALQLAKASGRALLSPAVVQEDRATVRRLLRAFMAAPSKEEAAVFGSLPFSDDVLDQNERPLAAPMTEEELASSHLLAKLLSRAGKRNGAQPDSAWFEGSAAAYSEHPARHLRQYAWFQYLRHWRKQALYQMERRKRL